MPAKHLVTSVNPETNTGVCSVCGVNTRLVWKLKPIKKEPTRKVYSCATSLLTSKGSKMRNKPYVSRDGKGFQSTKEGRRYEVLRLLEKAGEVRDLRTQVPYKLHGKNGGDICRYVADFVYQEKAKDGKFYEVVEDVKGFWTKEFKLKKRLFEDEYGVLRIT